YMIEHIASVWVFPTTDTHILRSSDPSIPSFSDRRKRSYYGQSLGGSIKIGNMTHVSTDLYGTGSAGMISRSLLAHPSTVRVPVLYSYLNTVVYATHKIPFPS